MHNYKRNSLVLVVFVCLLTRSLSDVFEACNADNDQQFIVSNTSCTHFILCNGEDSHEGECPEGDRFDAVEQMCELMEDIDCRTGNPIQTDNSVNEVLGNVTDIPVNNSTTVATPSSTVAEVSSPSAVDNSVVTSSTISSSNQVVTTVASICPRTDNPSQIVLLAHDQSCTDRPMRCC